MSKLGLLGKMSIFISMHACRGKQALLNYLEKDAGLRKDTILEDPELFRKGLGLVLGEHGAEVIEACIVERLVSSFELKQASDLTLAKAIEMIRTAGKRIV